MWLLLPGEEELGELGVPTENRGEKDYERTWGEDDGERRKMKDDGRRKEEIVDGGECYI